MENKEIKNEKNLIMENTEKWIVDALSKPEKKMFTTKENEEYCKQLLNDFDGIIPDRCVDRLYEIFESHPHWKEKEGCGIHHFEVRKGLYGEKCFYIVRIDCTSTDISYRKALHSYPTKRADIMKACRTVISPVIENLRNQIKLPFTCPVTGDVVTDKSDVHIDHYDLTFKELFDLWIKDKDIDEVYNSIDESRKDGCVEIHFNDPMLAMDFYDFHNNHTHLRVVSKKANLSVLKRKSVTAITTHEGREVSLW